jgi:hypothetical protein
MRRSPTMLLLSFLGLAFAVLSTFIVFFMAGYFSPGPRSHQNLALYGAVLAYPTVFISVFLNVALAYAASAAFDGERVSLREALDAAAGRTRTIALWSLITLVVGIVLNQIAERLPAGNRIVNWLLGTAWGLGTLFVVPMLAVERSPALPALRRSLGMAKRRWTEGLSGNIAIGAWTVVVAVPAVLVLVVGGSVLETNQAAGAVLVFGGLAALVAASTLSASLSQVFAVALYRHAIDAPAGGFSSWDLENPLTGKPKPRRKSWILRIGVPILVLFFALALLAAIRGPRDRATTDPYWHVRYAASHAHELHAGTPITYRGRRVGTVVSTTTLGPEMDVAFSIRPRFPPALVERGFKIVHGGGVVSLRIVGR